MRTGLGGSVPAGHVLGCVSGWCSSRRASRARSAVDELVRGAAVRMGRRAAAAMPVLAEVGIGGLWRSRAGTLSGGQQQRVALAMALVGDPALLLLDEPTVGLDVAARRAFWQILAARRDHGAGLLLTTHTVEETAAFADRVVVLHRGPVVAADTPTALTARTISARTTLDDTALRSFPGVASVERDGDRVRVATAGPETVLRSRRGGWAQRANHRHSRPLAETSGHGPSERSEGVR